MKALDRKLLRDLRALWSQALTIALVVASGVAGFVTTRSAVESLVQARDDFYAASRFADLFGSARRAPLALAAVLRDLPGVADLQTTVEFNVRLTLPGSSDPLIGQLVGVDPRQAAPLNRLVLRSGRSADGSEPLAQPWPGAPAADGTLPAWVSESFAQAHGLVPGARLQALVNGRQRTLQVAGVALSPEFVFAGLNGMPDQRGFGVFWIDHAALAAAFDMHGAFNRYSVRLAPQADARAVAQALAQRLAAYGGREPVERTHQTSHAALDNEIREQQVLGQVLPVIFLAVAAFLLNVVVSRLVATQREQIAALKALGYGHASVAAHYLKAVGAIVALGLALGLVAGKLLGSAFLGLYAEFFRFPVFTHHLAPGLAATSAAITAVTALAGALGALLASWRLTPAEAMRPPAPGRYRRTLVERLGLMQLPTALRMVLRQIERRPWRSGLTVAGMAAAVAIVVMGNFFRDAIDFIVDSQFSGAMRQDVTLWTLEGVDTAAAHELARLPGVLIVEPSRSVPVNLVHGHLQQRVALRGLPGDGQLQRLVDVQGHPTLPTGQGLWLTDRLAAKLALQPGDRVRVEVQDGRAQTLLLPVEATVREMMGLNATMELQALNRVLGDGPRANAFALAVQRGAEPALLEATRALPRVAGAFSKATLLRNMQEVSARNIRIMSTVLTVFASVIAVGVVYNSARIALAERRWELASLRVLGFSRGEVSALLLGELALLLALALPLGMVLGWALVHAVSALLASDQFAFPVVILPRTYALAGLCVLAAGAASAAVVRRQVDRLDMVAALKVRE